MRRLDVVSAVTSVMNREQLEFVVHRFVEANDEDDKTEQVRQKDRRSLCTIVHSFIPSVD